MTTRHVIGYLLILLMLAIVWWGIYNSERNVRRRARRARRQRYKARLADEPRPIRQETGPAK